MTSEPTLLNPVAVVASHELATKKLLLEEGLCSFGEFGVVGREAKGALVQVKQVRRRPALPASLCQEGSAKELDIRTDHAR